MKEDKDKILAFLIWFTKTELIEHMQFALLFYIVLSVCTFPAPFETFGPKSLGFIAVVGTEALLGAAYIAWYVRLKKTLEQRISNGYLFAGAVFGTTALVLFGSAAQVFYASGTEFGRVHIAANLAGAALNIFVLIIRIIQYRSEQYHTFGPAYGAGIIMPLVIAGGILLNDVERSVGKAFVATAVFTLGGYLMLCFALIFFIDLYVARRHNMDEYYIATNPPKNKK